MSADRKEATRTRWLETLQTYQRDPQSPATEAHWSPSLDTPSRDELTAIQNAKIEAVTPFLYENSPFYRRRFERLGLTPDDIRSVEDLTNWPIVDKAEIAFALCDWRLKDEMEACAAASRFLKKTLYFDAACEGRGELEPLASTKPQRPVPEAFSTVPLRSTVSSGGGSPPAPTSGRSLASHSQSMS